MDVDLKSLDFTNLTEYPNVGYDREGKLIEFSFNGNTLLRKDTDELIITNEAIEEWNKCKNDKEYFFETYIKIQTLDDGIIPFKLRPYQKEFLKLINDERFVLGNLARQIGKSTSVASEITWRMCFEEDYTVGIIANTSDLTLELVGMVKQMFELLPAFLKPGVKVWNTKTIRLENKNKILSAVAGPSALRGRSINLLLCSHYNETITLRNKKTYETETLKIGDFYKKLNSTLHQIEDTEISLTNDYEVLTKRGFESFRGIKKVNSSDNIKFIFSDDSSIQVTKEHRFVVGKNKNGKIFRKAYKIKKYDKIDNKIVSDIIQIKQQDFYFDLIDVKGHDYITSNITSHNCDEFAHIDSNKINGFLDSVMPALSSGNTTKIIIISTPKGYNKFYKFYKEGKEGINGYKVYEANWSAVEGRDEQWKQNEIKKDGILAFLQNHQVSFLGSSKTLLSPETLEQLTNQKQKPIDNYPIVHEDCLIYEYPIKSKDVFYTLGVDSAKISSTSKQNSDYVSLQVLKFDKNKNTITQVCSMKTRDMHYTELTEMIYDLAIYYSNALVLVENNGGEAQSVVDSLFDKYEYENIYCDYNRPDIQGFRTTAKSKKLGLSNLKKLIEDGILTIKDGNTIEEFFTFVHKNNSYAAQDKDAHDDAIMALVACIQFLQDELNDMDFTIWDLIESNKNIETNEGETNEEESNEDLDFVYTTNNDNTNDSNWLL